MEYIIADSATEEIQATNTDQVIEALLSRLQETADTLTPGTQIKRTLAGIRRKIDNFTISNFEVQDDFSATALNQGSWQEQTERTHRLACTYTVIAKIKLENNDIPGAMMAILEAATFHGLSAGFSHPRKISESERAIAGGKRKAEIHNDKVDKLIEFLEQYMPANGWPEAQETAKIITPHFQKYLIDAWARPADSPENIQKEILEMLKTNKRITDEHFRRTNPKARQ